MGLHQEEPLKFEQTRKHVSSQPHPGEQHHSLNPLKDSVAVWSTGRADCEKKTKKHLITAPVTMTSVSGK